MFGYVIPYKNELKIKEFELYKAYYCAICRSIKRNFGEIPRLFLSYDAVFLAILLSSLEDDVEEISTFRCKLKPYKKLPLVGTNAVIDYAAYSLVLLAYFKSIDDINDEHKIRGILIKKLLNNSSKTIQNKLPTMFEILSFLLKEQRCAENMNSSYDFLSESFGKIMGEIFDGYADFIGISSTSQGNALRKFGINLGKWIYLMDAIDDFKEDLKNKVFNPLSLIRDINDSILKMNSDFYINNMVELFGELDCKKNVSILENILYLGLPNKADILIEKFKLDILY